MIFFLDVFTFFIFDTNLLKLIKRRTRLKNISIFGHCGLSVEFRPYLLIVIFGVLILKITNEIKMLLVHLVLCIVIAQKISD